MRRAVVIPDDAPMTNTSAHLTGSAPVQGRLWGARARDFALMEPQVAALYDSALAAVDVGPDTRLLDVGCGAGGFLRMAAARGATVAGIDAAGPMIDIVRDALPDADLHVADMEVLPFADDSFDVITGFNAFQFAASPAQALREAARVGRAGAPVVIATWGPQADCEAAAYVAGVGALLPPPPPGAPGPFALSDPGAIEALATSGGLTPVGRTDVLCVFEFHDDEHATRGLSSTGFAVRAAEVAGDDAVREVILETIAPYAQAGGGYRIENIFTYLLATV